MSTILSWNMQGWNRTGGVSGEKITALLGLLEQHHVANAIFCLQECGNPETTGIRKGTTLNIQGGRSYRCQYIIDDETAKKYRCTTAIFADEAVPVQGPDMAFPAGVTRPLVYIVTNRTVIATFHATASGRAAVTEVKNIMKYLESLTARPDIDSWILIGDFNSHPEDYLFREQVLDTSQKNIIQFAGSETREGGQGYAFMICPDGGTQGPPDDRSNRLDFAFLSSDLGDANITPFGAPPGALVGTITMSNAPGPVLSDHNLVGFTI